MRSSRRKLAPYPIGYFHIDLAEVCMEEGKKLYLFVAVDRTSKYASARLTQKTMVPGRYNFAKRLKTLRGLTPYEAICTAWANEPDRFRLDPIH